MPQCDFNKIATLFPKNTSKGLVLKEEEQLAKQKTKAILKQFKF